MCYSILKTHILLTIKGFKMRFVMVSPEWYGIYIRIKILLNNVYYNMYTPHS